ncbi:YwqJ-related putative deaminase [Flavobacterium psychrotrophum]|uniref:YwqJ-related putative deaminase n=1 Tax=Flavobacterium psychrotrophum TaxID=2294119 RepID=UPI0013C406ED|nr:YwqJ-related putative deaminase [Flavobacterium psychrotrophum]
MGAISNLIEFLRLNRRSEIANKNVQPSSEVQLNYLEDGGENYLVTNEIFDYDTATYRRLSYIFDDFNPTHIYVLETVNTRKYFVQTQTNDYFNLYTEQIENPPIAQLVDYPVVFQYDAYVYDKSKNRVVYISEILDEIITFPDTIDINDQEQYIKDIESGEYEYLFANEKTLFANIVNILGYTDAIFYRSDRKVTLKKSDIPGVMWLIPLMEADLATTTFTLRYVFHKKGYQPSFGIADSDCALIIKFGSIGGLLSFLNTTLFKEGFSLSSSEDNVLRDTFRSQFRDQILRPVERLVSNNSRMYYLDAMKILNYLPAEVAVELSTDVLWMLVNEGIRRNSLTNKLGIAEENIFIKLLETILQKEGQQTKFIERLAKKVDEKGKLLLEYLYDRIHGDNGDKFIQMVNTAWRASRFVNPDPKANKEFAATDGPLMLPYESEKWLGFYFSNAKATFEATPQKERLLQVAYGTGKYHTVASASKTGEKTEEIIEYFWYHPFHPVYLKNLDKQEAELKLDTIIPAFMLLANRDKQFWSNVVTGGAYALDAIAIASGVGTIAELSAGVIRSFTILRAIGAIAEISGGAASAIIKLAGAEDSEDGQAFCEYMFWLEMASLVGVITASIKAGLKKSARKLVEKEEDLARLEQKLDEIIVDEEQGISRKLTDDEKDNFLDDLEKRAELDEGSGGIRKKRAKNSEPKIFLKKKQMAIFLKEYADEALTKWKDDLVRPGAVAVLEGPINNKIYQVISYTSKGVPKSKIVGGRHKLVQEWLTEIAKDIDNGRLIRRPTHGKCAEPVCISEFLFEAEKQLGLKANSMNITQAREFLSKTKIKAMRIHNGEADKLIHGLSKKACESCNPMLHYFKIVEIK